DKKPKMYNNQVKHQSTACVRDTEHAVRQCAALAKHRSEAQCGMPRPLRQQGSRPKAAELKIKFKLN
ncbi:MAG: hypothetical protein NZ455_04160, partial [Bacteroidia bacterium]|nr:hypothetical protein [Bacteroidia bacterium]